MQALRRDVSSVVDLHFDNQDMGNTDGHDWLAFGAGLV
jgi:hypothetical protein